MRLFMLSKTRFQKVPDRKASPASAVVRRVDASTNEIEVVRIEQRCIGGRRPVVASAARMPQRASRYIDLPATS